MLDLDVNFSGSSTVFETGFLVVSIAGEVDISTVFILISLIAFIYLFRILYSVN